MSNRREFFAAATAGLALASVGAPTISIAATPGVPRRLGGSPTRALFDSLQGQEFTVRLGAGERMPLRLLAVKQRGSTQPLEQFTLVLGGSTNRPLAAGVYALEHTRSGRFQLRLDPSGADVRGLRYRADLSLLV
jgi:hypothetical protein